MFPILGSGSKFVPRFSWKTRRSSMNFSYSGVLSTVCSMVGFVGAILAHLEAARGRDETQYACCYQLASGRGVQLNAGYATSDSKTRRDEADLIASDGLRIVRIRREAAAYCGCNWLVHGHFSSSSGPLPARVHRPLIQYPALSNLPTPSESKADDHITVLAMIWILDYQSRSNVWLFCLPHGLQLLSPLFLGQGL